jgi:hypothetical protein
MSDVVRSSKPSNEHLFALTDAVVTLQRIAKGRKQLSPFPAACAQAVLDELARLGQKKEPPAPETGVDGIDEGKLWSFLRDTLQHGVAIAADHADKSYEVFSARMDGAARERAELFNRRVTAKKAGEPRPPFQPNTACKTRDECRKAAFCMDGWQCSHGK